MLPENAVVAVCSVVADAEAAVFELRRQGVENGHISVVVSDQTGESAESVYHFGAGRLRRSPDLPSCRLWSLFPECAVLISPGEQTVILAGPLAASVARALEQRELLGKLGAVARSLYNLGIPQDAAREYELASHQGRALVVVHGRAAVVARARSILARWLAPAAAELGI